MSAASKTGERKGHCDRLCAEHSGVCAQIQEQCRKVKGVQETHESMFGLIHGKLNARTFAIFVSIFMMLLGASFAFTALVQSTASEAEIKSSVVEQRVNDLKVWMEKVIKKQEEQGQALNGIEKKLDKVIAGIGCKQKGEDVSQERAGGE